MSEENSPSPTIGFEKLIAGCVQIETDLGLPAGCLTSLPKEASDWSFVIKVATLVEAATTHLLTDEIADERIRGLLSRLPMQGRSGKLPLAKEWGLISKEDYDFAVGISNLRNDLAHDPQFVGFAFVDYLAALKGTTRRDFLVWAARGMAHHPGDKDVATKLRLQLWAQTAMILTKAMMTKSAAAAQRRKHKLYAELAESVLNAHEPPEYE